MTNERDTDEADCGDHDFYCGDPECDACVPPNPGEVWMKAYYAEAAKFQRETQRTSEALQLLRRLRQDMQEALLGSTQRVDWPKIDAAFKAVDTYFAEMGQQ